MPSFRWLEVLNIWSSRRVIECRFPAAIALREVDPDPIVREWRSLRCPPDRINAADRVHRDLRGPVSFALATKAVAAELQRQASGFRGRSWIANPAVDSRNGRCEAIVSLECRDFPFARHCLLAAEQMVLSSERGEPWSVAATISGLIELADESGLYEFQRFLMLEAARRDLPWTWIGSS